MNLHIDIRGEGEALVFFHGWGFDHQIWLNLANSLAKNYRCYLVDLPGFGFSSAMNWECFKLNLLKQLPTSFTLIGWSMGGLFATGLALEEERSVKQLINIASSPKFVAGTNWPGIKKEVFQQFFANLATNPQQTLTQFVRLQLKVPSSAENKPQQFHKGLNFNYQASLPSVVSLQAGLDLLADWDLRERLDKFTKPCTFFFGGLDAIVPRATKAAMQKRYPDFNYQLFPKAAHIPFLSHPVEFMYALEQTLK